MASPSASLASKLDRLVERRASARHPCQVGVYCWSVSGHTQLPGRGLLTNVSAGGVLLQTGRRHAPGEVLAIELPALSETVGGHLLRARVVYALMCSESNHWAHGCSLIQGELSEEELRALAEHQPLPQHG
jgi:hypothetical protein